MENLFYMMAYNNLSDICSDTAVNNILYLVGIVIAVVRIAVPILLIVLGMIDLLKAMSSQDDKEIKSATKLLVKRAVVAVVIFLIPTIVSLLMNIVSAVSDEDYNACTKCVTSVWGNKCSWKN